MKLVTKLLVATMLAASAVPGVASAQEMSGERVLSADEINELINRSRASGANVNEDNMDVTYMGAASETAAETVQCCENVEEQVTRQTEIEESTVMVDAVSERETIQPIERTVIQPIERRIVRGTTEAVTEDTTFEEERLPVRIEADPVPAVTETIIEENTTETRDDITETFVDVVTQRDIIQPIERVTVVPVQRRITRPRTETITAETRYETVRAPMRVEAAAIPDTAEYTTEQVNIVERDEITETFVDVVTERNVTQPVVRTVIQPIERRILRGTTETVTAPTEYREEILPVRIDEEPMPDVIENVIPQITERTVFEVNDVYVDQVTRNVIQPVVITTIQPVEKRVVNPRKETVTATLMTQEERLPLRIEADPVPETVVNFIPQVTVEERDEITETYFEAVTQRDVIQPIVTTLIQPIERRMIRGRTETITNPVQVETIRASMISMDMGSVCACTDTVTRVASAETTLESEETKSCDCDCDK